MSAKTTPAPWDVASGEYEDGEKGSFIVGKASALGRMQPRIAKLMPEREEGDEALLAAAPDLAAALERLYDANTGHDANSITGALFQARKALRDAGRIP